MSEFEPKYENKEQYKLTPEQSAEQQRKIEDKLEKEAAKAETERDSIEAIRERLEKAQQKQEAPQINKTESTGGEIGGHYGSSGVLKQASGRTIKQVQKQLPTADRAFSKVVHQPAVEAVSNAAEATVARPYGLLVGGIFSLISSIGVLYICRHYGYEYNFLVGLAAFGGGFIVGIVGEGLFKLSRLLRHK